MTAHIQISDKNLCCVTVSYSLLGISFSLFPLARVKPNTDLVNVIVKPEIRRNILEYHNRNQPVHHVIMGLILLLLAQHQNSSELILK